MTWNDISSQLEFNGSMIDVTPKTHRILKIFEPIIFPMDIALSLL
jgi:hypothetical protein